MESVKIWILIGLVIVTSTVLGFVGKVVTKLIITRLDEIVKELRALNTTIALHGQDIKNLQESVLAINHRLNNHADRIREIEMIVKPGK